MEKNVFSKPSKHLREDINSPGLFKATKIQELAIPESLDGSNVLLIVPTGTGKAEATVLPVFDQLLRERTKSLIHGISILYITPLRALNRDIFTD